MIVWRIPAFDTEKMGDMTMQQLPTTNISALLPTALEPVGFYPGDGQSYRIASSLIRAEPPTRFFAIAREGEALIGDVFTLEPELPFVAYIERMAEFHDLELLWAGWRVFLYLCGRPDQEPPEDLPRWRGDWCAALTTLPIATYYVSGTYGSATITVRRAGPKAFSALITDTAGRVCGEILSCSSAASALHEAQRCLIGDVAAIAC